MKIRVEFSDKLLKFASQKLENLKKGDFRICIEFLKTVVRNVFEGGKDKDEG